MKSMKNQCGSRSYATVLQPTISEAVGGHKTITHRCSALNTRSIPRTQNYANMSLNKRVPTFSLTEKSKTFSRTDMKIFSEPLHSPQMFEYDNIMVRVQQIAKTFKQSSKMLTLAVFRNQMNLFTYGLYINAMLLVFHLNL